MQHVVKVANNLLGIGCLYLVPYSRNVKYGNTDLLLSQNFMLKRIIMVNTKINLFFTEKTDDGTNNKEQHLHENKALVTSTSMEDSNELQTPKKGGDQTPAGYHTPFKDRYHVPLDFEEGLLCTSTPKQPLRQLLMTIKSIDDV
jgi:hypothetical protein